MATRETSRHPVARRREERGWSQGELSRRAGLPRTTVGAIELRRLTPSVSAALSLARALESTVEELFRGDTKPAIRAEPRWAWTPRGETSLFWEAEVGGEARLYPVEAPSSGAIPHDGVWQGGIDRSHRESVAEGTLVLACCDPAAGLLAAEYARSTDFRMLVFPRSGGTAVDLLKRGVVHVAGLHRSTPERPRRNLETVREKLGGGFRLIRAATWQEGLALPADHRGRSTRSALREASNWALREIGSGARECLDELCSTSGLPGRVVRGHEAVAEAVRAGWADAGVCVRLAAEEAGLAFLPIRTERLDLCFADSMANDPRLLALVRVLRSRNHRRLLGELPGYEARETGEIVTTC